jgi:hypothetical protein
MEQNLSEPTYTPEVLKKLKGVVSKVGADWCGIQETINPNEALLLFNSRKSNSTLAVKFDPSNFDIFVLEEAAAERLHKSDHLFKERKISVKESTLDRIQKTASEIVAEVEELRRRK